MTAFSHSSTRIKIGRHSIDVRMGGANATHILLLVHGIGVSGRYFHRFADVAATEYTVIVIDLPGYGKTPKPAGGPLDIVELAEIVIEFAQTLGNKKITLFGHSIVAQIVAHAASMQAELFHSIILSGPTTNKDERTIYKQGIRLAQDTLREPFSANCIIFTDYIRMGVVRYLKSAKYMIEDRLEESIRGCTLPILLIRGTNDVIAPKCWTSYLAEQSVKASVAEIADSPHVSQYARPKEHFEVCNAFLRT